MVAGLIGSTPGPDAHAVRHKGAPGCLKLRCYPPWRLSCGLLARGFLASSRLACSAWARTFTLLAADAYSTGWNSFLFFFASMNSLTPAV